MEISEAALEKAMGFLGLPTHSLKVTILVGWREGEGEGEEREVHGKPQMLQLGLCLPGSGANLWVEKLLHGLGVSVGRL